MRKTVGADIKRILIRFLMIIIPVMSIVLLFYYNSYQAEITKTKEIIVEQQKQKSLILDYVLEDIYNEYYEDLVVVKNSIKIAENINELNQTTTNELSQLLLEIAKTKKSFDQIRVINRVGEEVIRVNHTENGPELVPEDDLQNKGDRYYYIETSQLLDGEIFVSDLDLNNENGIIEEPYKPTIRFATPLYSQAGVYQGIIVINFLGQDLLNIFNQYFKADEYNFIAPLLVNDEGYYLYHDNQEKTFGFMFEEKSNETVALENPGLWDAIVSHGDGVYESDNIVNYYQVLEPLSLIDAVCQSHYSWAIITTFDLNQFPVIKDSILFGMKWVDLIILLGVMLLILLMVILNYYSMKDKQQLNLSKKIAEYTNDAVVITNEDTEIIYVNQAFERITQYKREEIIGLTPSHLKSQKQSKEFYVEMWKSIDEKGYWQGELWDKRKDGLLYPKKLSIFRTKDRVTNKKMYIGLYTDLTKLKEGEYNIEKLKNYNFETNLPNEHLLLRLITNNIEDETNQFFVIYFTIQNLNQLLIEEKDIHDLIKVLTERVKGWLNEEDFVAQITKSDFVIGVMSIKTVAAIEPFLTQSMNKNLRRITYKGKERLLDIRAGISIYPQDGKTANELMANAYIALEQVINKKHNRYEYYQPQFRKAIKKEAQIQLLLSKAIASGELAVYYQPQVKITDEEIVGAEALIRWNSKELGFISPSVFIPIAERTGQILEIGYWIIEQVICDYVKIKEQLPENFKISINISPIQLKDEALISKMNELFNQYEVLPNAFEIEITEGVFLEDYESVNEQLSEFKKMGMTIAIDDFGTGFSSLSYLRKLRIDKLKIDRSFIKDYPEQDNGEMAKMVTNMSKVLGLKVITEGAETTEQVNYLESIGCQLIQGYYYSKPLNLEQFQEYLQNKCC